MSKMKKYLITGLSYVLVAALAIGGTIAYLQDSDEDVNVMTLGNVQIEQIEQERVVENGAWVSTGEADKYGYTPDKLQPFTQAKPLYPAVFADGDIKWDDRNGSQAASGAGSHQQSWAQVGASGTNQLFDDSVKNVQDKFVFVKNTGKSDAYVRTWVALEQGDIAAENFKNVIMTNSNGSHWSWEVVATDVEIDGGKFYVLAATYLGPKSNPTGILAPNTVSYPSLLQVYMKPAATNDDVAAIDGNGNGTYDILVFSQAVQTAGFENATEALNAAFGTAHPWVGENAPAIPAVVSDEAGLVAAMNAGDDVLLQKDIEDVAVETKAPYGNYYGIKQDGNTIDGNGKVLDFSEGPLHNSRLDNYGIMTSGGTIKNVDVTGVFRGIMIMNPTENVYIDNVTIGGDDDMCYGINTGEKGGSCKLYVTNSRISGWNSIGDAVEFASFKDCTFGQGKYYTDVYGRLVKPYVNAVFENCEFSSMYYIDLSSLMDGQTVTLRNCTVNGVKLTAQNWKDLIVSESDCGAGQISIEAKNGSYMTASNVLDYVVIE